MTRNEPEECCHRPPEARNPYCIQIDIPHDDPFYGVYGVRCIDFVRGFPGVRAGCRMGKKMKCFNAFFLFFMQKKLRDNLLKTCKIFSLLS